MELYGYRRRGEWMEVPRLAGGITLSYLPLLNYSDLDRMAAQRLLSEVSDENYLIRFLDPDGPLKEQSPVTMRLTLEGGEAVWEKRLSGKCRNQVRKAMKSGVEVVVGSSETDVAHFYSVFAHTMHRYGAPVLPRRLFSLLMERFDARCYQAYVEGQLAAALVVVQDSDLTWVPWAGSNPRYSSACPNHLLYWRAIEESIARKDTLFDFGRSPLGGNSYRFKRQWGAQPVPICLMSSAEGEIYSRYRFAQQVWRRLPSPLVNVIGPRLSRYLADY